MVFSCNILGAEEVLKFRQMKSMESLNFMMGWRRTSEREAKLRKKRRIFG